MKPRSSFGILAIFTSTIVYSAHAQEVVKANNTNNMNLGTSWVGGNVPGVGNVAVFNDTFTSVASLGTGGALAWGGLKITGSTNPGPILVNNTTTANRVQTGASGIDMSTAPRDFTIASFDINGTQAWTVPAGRTLSLGKSSTDGHEKITGGTDATVTMSGAGIVVLEGSGTTVGGGTGGGGKNHNANLVVQSGITLRMTASTGVGTATGTTTIQNGGTLALAAAGLDLRGEQFTISGSGVGGNGAIQNTSGAQLQNAFDKVILAGDSTISTVSRIDIRDPNRTGLVALDLAGFTLTKTGANVLFLDGNTISSGDIIVEQGDMGFQNGVIVAANPGDVVTVKNTGSLLFWRSTSGTSPCVFERDVVVEDGGGIRWNGNLTADEVDQRVDSNIQISGTASITQQTTNGSIFELAGEISGSGGITIDGTGILRLSGANTFAGPTQVTLGTTQLTGSLTGDLTIAAGASVTGTGSVVGAVTANGSLTLDGAAGQSGGLTVNPGGVVNPAGPAAIGSIETASLTLDNGDLVFDASSPSELDTITIAPNGAFNATGSTIIEILPEGGWDVGFYPVIQYSGTTTSPGASPFNLIANLGHANGGLVDTGSAIALHITSAPASVWSGATDGEWDLATLNWQSSDQLFLNGDPVVFDDSASGNFDINLDSVVTPSKVTISNSGNDYTLSSALNTGSIAGVPTSLVKTGTGSAAISTTNTFGGGTTISNGTLALLSDSVNPAPSLGTGPIEINDPGLLQVGITGPVANQITGDGEVLIDHPTDNIFVSINGDNSYTGQTTVELGNLNIGHPNALGDPGTGTYVKDAGRIYFGIPLANNSTVPEPITFEGGPDVAMNDLRIGNNLSGITLTGQVSIENDVIMGFDAGTSLAFAAPSAVSYSGAGTGADLRIQGEGGPTISGTLFLGTGNLIHQGPGTLTLSGSGNSYVNTNVDSGTLALTGNGTLGSGTNTIAAGAFLALSGTLNSPFSASLTGDGTLVKAGAGNAELATINHLAGGTRLDDGLLLVGADGLLGAGQLHLNGGALVSKDANPRTIPNPVLLDNLPAFGDINNVFNAPVEYTGNISFNGLTRWVRTYTPTTWSGGSNNGGLNYKLGLADLTLKGFHDWSTGGATEVRQGSLIVDGGTVTNFDAIRVMATDPGGTARLAIINGGSVTIQGSNSNLRLGYSPGGNATGTNIADIAGTLDFGTVANGGKVGLGTNSVATELNLNAGADVNTAAIQDLNASSNDVVNANGGKITVITDNLNTPSTAFMQGLDAVNILDGGLTIDTNGNNARVNQAMQAGGTNIGGLTKQGLGTLTLGSGNAYGGPTSVEAGTLTVLSPGSTGAGPTTIEAAATLAGDGTVNAGATVHGTISPGTSVGPLIIGGTLAMATNSFYDWEVTSWTPLLPGINHDTVVATTLNITADAANPVTIVVAGTPGDFAETNVAFPIIQTSGGITGFAANKFTVDASAFTGSGSWSVDVDGNNLMLIYTAGTGNDYESWADSFSLVGTERDLDEDPDKDGMNNRQEYAFGLDPTSGSSVNPVIVPLDSSSGLFTYTRRKISLSGFSFAYESSATLNNPWGALTPESETSDNGDPIEEITVEVPAALLAEPKLFVRVLAEQP